MFVAGSHWGTDCTGWREESEGEKKNGEREKWRGKNGERGEWVGKCYVDKFAYKLCTLKGDEFLSL